MYKNHGEKDQNCTDQGGEAYTLHAQKWVENDG